MPSSVVLTMPGYCPASIRCFSSLPLGPPAISTRVGSQSRAANISFLTVPGLMTPGPRPGAQLAALEGGDAAVREGDGLGAVVGGEDDDRVVELAHVFELLEHH